MSRTGSKPARGESWLVSLAVTLGLLVVSFRRDDGNVEVDHVVALSDAWQNRILEVIRSR